MYSMLFSYNLHHPTIYFVAIHVIKGQAGHFGLLVYNPFCRFHLHLSKFVNVDLNSLEQGQWYDPPMPVE